MYQGSKRTYRTIDLLIKRFVWWRSRGRRRRRLLKLPNLSKWRKVRYSRPRSWEILRRGPLLLFSFYRHEALRGEKRKPPVKTVGILTFMPSAFDRRFWLGDIFNCSTSHMIGWIKYLFGVVIGQKKMTPLTAVKCWASMKKRFSTILTRGFLFSRLGASISASRRKFPNKKNIILKESLWDQGKGSDDFACVCVEFRFHLGHP